MQEPLEKILAAIPPVKEAILSSVQARLDRLTKPVGSLGQLEELAKRYAGIVENVRPGLGKKIIFTFAADHGVVAEGVSAYPKEVTCQMVCNFLRQGAGINVLARHAGAEIVVVDIGVDHDFEPAAGLVIRKVARGTRNMAHGPAMSVPEARGAIEVGLEMADYAFAQGATLVGTGDMGIGNTTASSAILSSLTGLPAAEVTHRGTGLDDPGLQRKIRTIEQAIRNNAPDPRNPLEVLAKVGGLEIAGIAGLIIGCAFRRIPVVVDGFISTAGAMIAVALNPAIRDYLFASHQSAEIGHRFMWEYLGQKPILNLSLRLGEGTGAALAMGIIEAAVKILNQMATFAEAGVSERNP
jgi:nicotinate-nucleotide--dimethylbenzimidazole phosphoribosyltransferase